jgi:NAD(P)-dependent dehydrogenase (short-subunit alcohol dehydrogenase family)
MTHLRIFLLASVCATVLATLPHCFNDPNRSSAKQITAEDVVKGHSLDGVVAVISGGDSGIGLEVSKTLAMTNATIIIAAYNEAHGSAVAANVSAETGNSKVYAEQVDLSSFSSVRAFAKKVVDKYHGINFLINDAGIDANPVGLAPITADGFERVFQVNYLGPFLLTEILWPTMIKSSSTTPLGARVINMASGASYQNCDLANRPKDCLSTMDDWKVVATTPPLPKTVNGTTSNGTNYGITKFAQVAQIRQLALAREGGKAIHAYSLRPGLVETPMTDPIPIPYMKYMCSTLGEEYNPGVSCPLSAEQGAATAAMLAVSATADLADGKFYYQCTVAPDAVPQGWDWATMPALLYKQSLKWVGRPVGLRARAS